MPLEAVRFIATPYQYLIVGSGNTLVRAHRFTGEAERLGSFRLEKDDPRGFLNRPERGKAQSTDAHCDEGPLAIHFRALGGTRRDLIIVCSTTRTAKTSRSQQWRRLT
jgi:hypothetical protein